MKVTLIGYTRPVDGGNPVDVVELAATKCYDRKPTKGYAIAKACAKSGHRSVWEHINFVFQVSGVSRALLAQITRHRHFSFSVRSQRYCDESGFAFVTPFKLEADKEFLEGMNDAGRHYDALTAKGVPSEDARAVLPNACATEFVISSNARAWIEASHLRLCTRAQAEIRQMFGLARKEIDRVCPEVAKLMVPSCEAHEIPFCEERKGCGRHPKLEEMAK